MPVSGAGQVGGSAQGGAVADRILSRGLHPAGTDCADSVLQPESGLRYSVPGHRAYAQYHRPRSQTSGSGDRILRRFAHVGAEPAAPSSSALRGSGRRAIAGRRELDILPSWFLSPRQSALASVSPPGSRTTPGRVWEGKTPLLRRT